MINRVRSNKATFKPIEFKKGFNIVLADRTQESTKKDSRNGLGKSTLIDIIHFCFGASAKKGQGLMVDKLMEWSFILDLTLGGQEVSVWRNVSDPNKVFLDGDYSSLPVKPKKDVKTGNRYFGVNDWNEILGELLFGLKLSKVEKKYSPSFRNLISYFIRRGNGAFLDPFENFSKQREWDKQVCNTFLLGLSWEHAKEIQLIKDKEKTIDEIKKGANLGILKGVFGSIGELETAKIKLENNIRKLQEQLTSYKVHPQYKEFEDSVNELTEEIHMLVNENMTTKQILNLYQDSLVTDQEPQESDVDSIYKEVKIQLPSLVKRHLEDVKNFHEQLLTNRRNFLEQEITRLRSEIFQIEEKIKQRTNERAGYLEIINTHGALEEYTKLQEYYSKELSKYKELDNKIDNLKKIEQGKSSLRVEKELLQQRARSDYEERHFQREQAVALFNANSEALYSAPGKLVVDVTKTGFKFDVEIERSKSTGINNMKIFCYDLMLAQLWSDKEPSPKLLIHDSTLFDGVDERQVALAIELAAAQSKERDFQYICTFNTDALPWKEFSKDFTLNDFVRQRLTDDTDEGGLLGIRF